MLFRGAAEKKEVWCRLMLVQEAEGITIIHFHTETQKSVCDLKK